MSKKTVENCKKYLKAIGWVNIGIAALTIITAIIMMIAKAPLDQLQLADADKLIKEHNMSEDTVRVIACCTIIFTGLISAFFGNVIRRAGVNTKKTTLALVFVVLGSISAATGVFNGKFESVGATIANILHLTVYILAFMAIMKIRNEEDK